MTNKKYHSVADESKTPVPLQSAGPTEAGMLVSAATHTPREYLTPAEMVELLGVSLRTVANLRARHVLPFVKLGRVVRFRRSQVEAALEAHTIQSINWED